MYICKVASTFNIDFWFRQWFDCDMKVAFMVPSVLYAQNEHIYKRVNAAIEQAGHTLCLPGDGLLVSEAMGDKNALDAEDWQLLCSRELVAAQECDAAIVDVTDKATFGVGYFAATALQAGKPTLFLMHKNSLQGSVISGLQHKRLSRAVYDEYDAKGVVLEYLRGVGERI